MNRIVSVPLMRVPIPWARRPNLFATEFLVVEELLVFQGRSGVGVDDSVGKTKECLVQGELWLQQEIMLWA